MKLLPPKRMLSAFTDPNRRRLLAGLLAGGGIAALGGARSARSEDEDDDLGFPGEEPGHRVVYQFNQASQDYHDHVLGSVSAMLRTYPDDIHVVVSCFGKGIHILARHPTRPVAEQTRERVKSLSYYGVEFHACGRTMQSLGWSADDLYDFVKVVPVGAADLMELQEQSYAYIAW
jgi:intracellular sulfur oxidation DsrE/DsrF family protein